MQNIFYAQIFVIAVMVIGCAILMAKSKVSVSKLLVAIALTVVCVLELLNTPLQKRIARLEKQVASTEKYMPYDPGLPTMKKSLEDAKRLYDWSCALSPEAPTPWGQPVWDDHLDWLALTLGPTDQLELPGWFNRARAFPLGFAPFDHLIQGAAQEQRKEPGEEEHKDKCTQLALHHRPFQHQPNRINLIANCL